MSAEARAPIGIGVIGSNSFVANAAVMPAIERADNADLVANASRGAPVPSAWASTDVGDYDAVLHHPDVDAVYIPLPNGMHREWTERAAAAGKHVLCEKPLAPDAATARAMVGACEAAGVLLAEAWMTPFSRRYQRVFDVLALTELGAVEQIESHFTFTIDPSHDTNYRWDPDQGGGALLDVGIYCLGPAAHLFGSAPDAVTATQTTTARGVDARTDARLHWDDGRSVSITCSFVDDERQSLRLDTARGGLHIDAEAFTGGVDAREIEMDLHGLGQIIQVPATNDPYQAMIEAFAEAVAGRSEWPRPAERSIEMLELIERIRDAVST